MQKLTAKEEEVMELMWQLGECAPKDIVAQYSEPQPHVNTIATMEPDETWTIQPGEVKLNTAQIAASRYGTDTGKQFHVSSPKEAAGQIIIKRIR